MNSHVGPLICHTSSSYVQLLCLLFFQFLFQDLGNREISHTGMHQGKPYGHAPRSDRTRYHRYRTAMVLWRLLCVRMGIGIRVHQSPGLCSIDVFYPENWKVGRNCRRVMHCLLPLSMFIKVQSSHVSYFYFKVNDTIREASTGAFTGSSIFTSGIQGRPAHMSDMRGSSF